MLLTMSVSSCAPARHLDWLASPAAASPRLLDLTSGTLMFEGNDISTYSRRRLRPVRRELQMVFQDPYASLNPRKRVGTILSDPLRVHRVGTREQIRHRVVELLELVGLSAEH